MTTTLMVLQAIIAVLLIIVVLLQFGKGAEAGLMSAAGSESIMSSSTRGNIMTKITAVLAILFLANSIVLAKLQNSKFEKSLLDGEAPVARPLNMDATTATAPTTAPTTETTTTTTKEPTGTTTPAATETH